MKYTFHEHVTNGPRTSDIVLQLADAPVHHTGKLWVELVIYNYSFLQETLVHSSNSLAIQSLKCTKKDLSFFKSCVTFSEVTIPSISGQRQFDLFLETAEVGMSVFGTLKFYVLFVHLFIDL